MNVISLSCAGLKSRFRGSWAGFIWVAVAPMIMLCAQTFTLSILLHTTFYQYLVFLISGLIPWLYFSQTLEMSVGVIAQQSKVWKMYHMHPIELVLVQLVENFICFAPGFTLAFVLGLNGDFSLVIPRLLTATLALLSLSIGTLGISFILALAQVRFYDTRFILNPLLSVLFYLTPVLYPLELVPEKWRWIVKSNPLSHLFGPIRQAMNSTAALAPDTLIYSLLFSCILLISSLLIWRGSRYAVVNRL